MNSIRTRIAVACDKCAQGRARCDGEHPCRRCREYDYECSFNRPIRKRGRRRTNQVPIQSPTHHPTNEEDSQGYSEIASPTRASPRDVYSVSRRDASAVRDIPDNEASASPVCSHNGLPVNGTTGQSQVAGSREELRNVRSRTGNQHVMTTSTRNVRLPPEEPCAGYPGAQYPQSIPQVQSNSNETSRYPALRENSPLLDGLIELELANELLDIYFTEPDGSWFNTASPYVLSPVIRKDAVTRPECLRPMSAALVVTILWTVTQTHASSTLLRPGKRIELASKLQDLALSLFHDRDIDHWHRLEGQLIKKEHYTDNTRRTDIRQNFEAIPLEDVDDLLTLILFTVVTSAGNFKSDALLWQQKAIRLAKRLGFNRLDSCKCVGGLSDCNSATCISSNRPAALVSLHDFERKEEVRRAFWLLFALDRHLCLSWNSNLSILDDECLVFQPLPEDTWRNLHEISLSELPYRRYGPSTAITGVGFFEYFLPLMTILGDVIDEHHRSNHPRFGCLNHQDNIILISGLLENCSKGLDVWAQHLKQNNDEVFQHLPQSSYDFMSPVASNSWSGSHTSPDRYQNFNLRKVRQSLLVILYSRFIIHVLYVLLYGKWDAISMLSSEYNISDSYLLEHLPFSHPQRHHISEWIASESFATCASHAVSASEIVSELLVTDPELTFMPYLFGIYLLHGSSILLLFADRMPGIGHGRNESVEKACETIIRAHEVCVVTLPTEFQKRFRGILRATLCSVRDNMAAAAEIESEHTHHTVQVSRQSAATVDAASRSGRLVQPHKTTKMLQARRELFDLYRWTNGSRGLAIS